MVDIAFDGIVFEEDRWARKGKVTFDIVDQNVKVSAVITYKTVEKDPNNNTRKPIADDVTLVREARRRLHEFATLLSEQTKDWAAP